MPWVRLNVGGEMMETQQATLTKYPASALARRFLTAEDDSMETVSLSEGAAEEPARVHCIDCDPHYFRLILSWQRLYNILSSKFIKKLSFKV